MKASSKIDLILQSTGDIALRRRAKMLLSKINFNNKIKVLDAGCGDGFYLHLISKLNPRAKLTGLDLDPQALKSAKANLPAKINLLRGDVTKLPFQDSEFEVVLFSEVLEHLADDKKAIAEACRVLKPHGLLLITVPHLNFPFLWDPINKTLQTLFKTHIKEGFLAGIWNQHLRLYTKKTLKKAILSSPFEIVKLVGLTHYCLPFNHYLLNLAARLLYGRHLPKNLVNQISKFQSQTKRSTLVNLAFKIVNWVDRYNDRLKDNKITTVGLLALCRKK